MDSVFTTSGIPALILFVTFNPCLFCINCKTSVNKILLLLLLLLLNIVKYLLFDDSHLTAIRYLFFCKPLEGPNQIKRCCCHAILSVCDGNWNQKSNFNVKKKLSSLQSLFLITSDLWVMGPARFHCATLLLLYSTEFLLMTYFWSCK